MTELHSIQNCGEEIEALLHLKTFPFAVKLLKSEDDIPEGALRPKRDLGHMPGLYSITSLRGNLRPAERGYVVF